MIKTNHMKARMSQRGINQTVVTILSIFGVTDGDRVSLSRNNCEYISEVLLKFKRLLDRMAQKGGHTMVSADDVLMTVYRNKSYNEYKVMKKGLISRRWNRRVCMKTYMNECV